MLEGARVRDLQRLSGPVLAGVLPRLYPRMLDLAYEHQDAGRPIFICTAAAQEMAELMAIVLTFDGAVGSVAEVIDGVYTGREGGPFNYREGKAQAIRELAEREGIDLERQLRLQRLASPTCRCCGWSGILSPSIRTRNWRAWRARRGGRSCGSSDSVGSCGWRRPRRCSSGGIGPAPGRVRTVELSHELDRRPARDPRADQALRGREDRARTPRSGTASTTSPASCSPSSASSA